MNKFEENIKQSLENFEVPYDPKAWEKLSKKLDQKENKSNNKSTKGFNNFLFVGVTTLIVAGIYLITNYRENSKHNSTSIKTESENNPELKIEAPKNEIVTQIEEISQNEVIKVNKKQEITKEKTRELTQKEHIKEEKKELNGHNSPQTEKQNSKSVLNHISNIEIPKTKTSYCENEAIYITNTNNFNLYLINEKGRKMYKIPANATNKYSIKETGAYEWLHEENTTKTYKAFEIIENPSSNFTISNDLEFTDGIPKLNCSTTSNASVQWMLNNKFITSNKEFTLAIFSKGMNTITLKIENHAGCKSTTVKSMNVEENYNLLAVTGFEPNHYDSKRNAFIPYALTLRNTPFKMVIIDPKNDKIIFETNDSSKPWDGIDQTTDELVPQNSTYIWKVTLFKPEKNEKSEYVGKITRI
jgi:hypothetical protein